MRVQSIAETCRFLQVMDLFMKYKAEQWLIGWVKLKTCTLTTFLAGKF